MKLIIASDIHGSAYWCGKLMELVDREQPDKLVLLGGRNIGDRYFGPEGYGAGLSIDRDVLVYNTAYPSGGRESVLFDVRDYMDGIWAGENVTQPFDRDSGGSAALREQLSADFRALRAQHPSLFDTQVDFAARTFAANKVTFS